MHKYLSLSLFGWFKVRTGASVACDRQPSQKWGYDYTEVVSIQAQDTDSRHGKFM